eukprot:c15716_g1_i1 orf=72-911(+)
MPQPIRAMRAHRVLIGGSIINVMLSIALTVVGFWLAFRHHINCLKFLEIPLIFIGLALLLVSVVGLMVIHRHKLLLVAAYLVLLFFLLLLLLAFTVFAYLVTNASGGHAVPAANFQEYDLADYSQWLQNQIRDSYTWLGMESCLKDGKICSSLNKKYTTLAKFMDAPLSPVQSGCCKPPSACEFTFVKPTQWTTATRSGASSDCGLWDNTNLCYECNTCKAGLLENVRRDWRKVAKLCTGILVLLILVYFVLWWAFMTSHNFHATHRGFSKSVPGEGAS